MAAIGYVTAQNGGARKQRGLGYRLVRQECFVCDGKSGFDGHSLASRRRFSKSLPLPLGEGRGEGFADFAIALAGSACFPYRQRYSLSLRERHRAPAWSERRSRR